VTIGYSGYVGMALGVKEDKCFEVKGLYQGKEW